MTIEQQCCTLQQAKRLKELGVEQDSLFSWFGDETRRLMDNGKDGAEYGPWLFLAQTEPVNNQEADYRSDVCCTKPIVSAYTVAELGVMLPAGYDTMKITVVQNEYTWQGYDYDGQDCSYGTFETEAQCRAAMLIHLIENKSITVQEINTRLMAG